MPPSYGAPLRRLFSSFASGWPGAGLLLLRLISGIALVAQGITALRTRVPMGWPFAAAVSIAAAVLLLAGLWTPLAGTVVAALGAWNAVSQPGDPWSNIFLATIGAALGLLRPGALSVDARIFGWRRIDVRDSNG